MCKGQEEWKSVYEFDTPVVRIGRGYLWRMVSLIHYQQIHVERIFNPDAKPAVATAPAKLMHRFEKRAVERLIDDVGTYP